jgi:hypothetical protein
MPDVYSPLTEAADRFVQGAQVAFGMADQHRRTNLAKKSQQAQEDHLKHIEELQNQAALREVEMHRVLLSSRRAQADLYQRLAPYEIKEAQQNEERGAQQLQAGEQDLQRGAIDLDNAKQASAEKGAARKTGDALAYEQLHNYNTWLTQKVGDDPDMMAAADEQRAFILKASKENPEGVRFLAEGLKELGTSIESKIFEKTLSRVEADLNKQEQLGVGDPEAINALRAMIRHPDPQEKANGLNKYYQRAEQVNDDLVRQDFEDETVAEIEGHLNKIGETSLVVGARPTWEQDETKRKLRSLLHKVRGTHMTERELFKAKQDAFDAANPAAQEPKEPKDTSAQDTARAREMVKGKEEGPDGKPYTFSGALRAIEQQHAAKAEPQGKAGHDAAPAVDPAEVDLATQILAQHSDWTDEQIAAEIERMKRGGSKQTAPKDNTGRLSADEINARLSGG